MVTFNRRVLRSGSPQTAAGYQVGEGRDCELILNTRNGCKVSSEQLFYRLRQLASQSVRGLGRLQPALREELVVDVMSSFWVSGIRHAKFEAGAKLGAYIEVATRNLYKKKVGHRASRQTISLFQPSASSAAPEEVTLMPMVAWGLRPDEAASEVEQYAIWRKVSQDPAILLGFLHGWNSLSQEHQTVMQRDFAGDTYLQGSAVLGFKLGNYKMVLRRARLKLQSALETALVLACARNLRFDRGLMAD